MTNGIYTILLLIMSNVFMTFAWYGHLRLQQAGISNNWPLYLVIAFSWVIAFFEYCCQVPANRIGFVDNGAAPLEPCRCSPLSCGGCLLRLHETITIIPARWSGDYFYFLR